MRYLRLLVAAILILALGSQVGAQTAKPVSEVVVTPFIVADKDPQVACLMVGKAAERIAAFFEGTEGLTAEP